MSKQQNFQKSDNFFQIFNKALPLLTILSFIIGSLPIWRYCIQIDFFPTKINPGHFLSLGIISFVFYFITLFIFIFSISIINLFILFFSRKTDKNIFQIILILFLFIGFIVISYLFSNLFTEFLKETLIIYVIGIFIFFIGEYIFSKKKDFKNNMLFILSILLVNSYIFFISFNQSIIKKTFINLGIRIENTQILIHEKYAPLMKFEKNKKINNHFLIKDVDILWGKIGEEIHIEVDSQRYTLLTKDIIIAH